MPKTGGGKRLTWVYSSDKRPIDLDMDQQIVSLCVFITTVLA
jgi:hypothetical protein